VVNVLACDSVGRISSLASCGNSARSKDSFGNGSCEVSATTYYSSGSASSERSAFRWVIREDGEAPAAVRDVLGDDGRPLVEQRAGPS